MGTSRRSAIGIYCIILSTYSPRPVGSVLPLSTWHGNTKYISLAVSPLAFRVVPPPYSVLLVCVVLGYGRVWMDSQQPRMLFNRRRVEASRDGLTCIVTDRGRLTGGMAECNSSLHSDHIAFKFQMWMQCIQASHIGDIQNVSGFRVTFWIHFECRMYPACIYDVTPRHMGDTFGP